MLRAAAPLALVILMSASGAAVAEHPEPFEHDGPAPGSLLMDLCPRTLVLAPGERGSIRGEFSTHTPAYVRGAIVAHLQYPEGDPAPPAEAPEHYGWRVMPGSMDFEVHRNDGRQPFEIEVEAPPTAREDAPGRVVVLVAPGPGTVLEGGSIPLIEVALATGAPGGVPAGDECVQVPLRGFAYGGLGGLPFSPFPHDGLSPGEAAVMAAATTGALAGGAVFLWRDETRRMRLLAPFLGLFTRLAKPQVLGHETRQRILEAISASPGVTFSDLKKRFSLNNGTLLHHLRTLESHKIVTSRKEGKLRRFYPAGARLAPPRPKPLPPVAAETLAIVSAEGERPFQELMARLGISKQRLSYNVKALEKQGLAEVAWRAQDGRWVVRRLADGDASRSVR